MRAWPALEVPLRTDETADRLLALLHDYDVTAIGESAGCWQIVFSTAAARDAARAGIARAHPDLALTSLQIPDGDWAARSQAGVRAVAVGGLVVAPPWDVPDASDAIVIVIEPSMGFGTGHHETTRLCLAALQRLDLRGSSVVDVGTGSGVLALAASRLGAEPVAALDHDPDAIASAAANLRLNPDARVDLRLGGLETTPDRRYDVVVANLTGGVLVREAAVLRAWCVPAGSLVLSGFLLDEEAGVVEAFPGLAVVDRTEEREWGCLRLAPTVRTPASG